MELDTNIAWAILADMAKESEALKAYMLAAQSQALLMQMQAEAGEEDGG